MFQMEDKEKEAKESALEKLIEELLMMSDKKDEGSAKEEASESPGLEKIEDLLGDDKPQVGSKPKLEMKVMKIEAKPKFKMPDGSEAEDESLEDLIKRKKLEG